MLNIGLTSNWCVIILFGTPGNCSMTGAASGAGRLMTCHLNESPEASANGAFVKNILIRTCKRELAFLRSECYLANSIKNQKSSI